VLRGLGCTGRVARLLLVSGDALVVLSEERLCCYEADQRDGGGYGVNRGGRGRLAFLAERSEEGILCCRRVSTAPSTREGTLLLGAWR